MSTAITTEQTLGEKLCIAWGIAYSAQRKGEGFREAVNNVVKLYEERDDIIA